MTARCEITQLPLGECAGACCKPELRMYQPIPEVWMRPTVPVSNMVVLPFQVSSVDEVVDGLHEAPAAGEKIELVDMVRELCEPTQHREPYYVVLTGKTLYHATFAPPLMLQLFDAVEPSSSTEGGSGVARIAASRPAARIDAIDTAFRIQIDAARWLRKLGLDDVTGDALDHIRRLHPHALTESELARDVRRWWTWARIVTGWDLPAWQPDNTCPLCGVRGTLRVRLVEKLATCINDNCRETWDEVTIGLLADHIRSENHEDEEAS